MGSGKKWTFLQWVLWRAMGKKYSVLGTELMGRWVGGWMDRWMDQWMDGWIYGQMEERKAGWIIVL